ncbi:uncharacterized protein DEA37_0007625 [Paragonimus westermani]|uniref:VHS domain-containing protein n=1 Tax=Paragonimus westermani TaxID=34504 RepID=A0A5J4NHJ0_9TREM|nr:uncharacterized protein DEA37_0007625 [Paragonimus westermani]
MSVTSAFADLFLGSPFSTEVGSLIEEATEDFVANVDLWQLFTRICDTVNRSPTGPKDAVRAIRRRFTTSVCSNESVAMNTLLLLEVCMSRCGYRFYVALGTRENLRELAKYAAPEVENVPECVRTKLLALLQTWALQFEKQVDLQEFVVVYAGLKGRGVSFPDPVSPTKNKPSAVTATGDASVTSCPRSPSLPNAVVTGQEQPATQMSGTTTNSASRDSKLNSDLAQVRVNICVLSDLITEAETSETVNSEAKQLMAVTATGDASVTSCPRSPSLPNAVVTGQEQPATQMSGTTTNSASRDSKLNSDLAQVRVNICVLSDLITEAETSETVNSEAKQLMADVAAALQEMSRRLIQAISCWEAYQETLPSRGTTDSVLLDLINVNDELHTVLLRYSRTVHTDPDTTCQNQTPSVDGVTNEETSQPPANGTDSISGQCDFLQSFQLLRVMQFFQHILLTE